MEITKDYIVVVNGRPFFSVANPCHLLMVKAEAGHRFGESAKIEVFVQTTEPYEAEPVVDSQ